MKILTLLALLLTLSLSLNAQGDLPESGLVGLWEFDDASDLEMATIGNDLIRDTVSFEFDINGFTAVDGPEPGNGAVRVALGSFYRCEHDIEANGFDPAFPDSIPSRVNQFSFVIDFKKTINGVWYGFHASDNGIDPQDSDWDSFIRSNGRIGVGSTGYSFYEANDTENFYRLVITSDLGNKYQYWLDGQLLQDGSPRSIDDRFSLDSPDATNSVLFFGDNDGEDADIDVAVLAVYDRALSAEEIIAMGGYGHSIPYGPALGQWDFDDAEDILAATTGEDLVLTGSHVVVDGPDLGGIAARVGNGSYYTATHGLYANGASEEPTKVNRYTIAMDVSFPQAGVMHAILQTDPANSNDAELYINEMGKLGSDVLGWSDSTLVADEWYRVAMTVSLDDTVTDVMVSLDGVVVLEKDELTADSDLALESESGANAVHFFADNDGEDNDIDVSALSIYNRNMDADELADLGGFVHNFGYEPPVAENRVFDFDGQTSYASITNDLTTATMPVQAMSVEMWVKLRSAWDWGGFLSAFQDNGGYEKGWVVGNRGEDPATFSFGLSTVGADDGDEGSMDYLQANYPIEWNRWYHLAVTYDGAITKIYVDGDLKNTMDTQFGDINYDTNAFFDIGSYHDENEFFVTDGNLDEIRLYNVALDSSVIRDYMFQKVDESHPNYAGLISYWDFDELDGPVAPDMKGDNDAQLLNMPASNYMASSSPVGNSGAYVNTQDPTTAGEAGAEITATITSTPDDDNFLGIYTQGMIGDAWVMEELFPIEFNSRGPVLWGIKENGEVTADLEMSYAGFNDLPTDLNSLVLLKRDDVFSPWVDISDVASNNTGEMTFSVNGVTEFSEFAIAWDDPTSIGEDVAGLPTKFDLRGNYPNPFNPTTTIVYDVPVVADMKLVIYNTLGQKVATVVDAKNHPAGRYKIVWNAQQLSSGVYFYRFESSQFSKTRKMVLVK
jgi:hypothetical protein